eukprot:10879714-Alexandrium_andersonii.AAC.1
MVPELAQRIGAELLAPYRVSSASALQPALLKLNDQGPFRLLEGVEETRATCELELKRAERQVGR